VIKDKNQIKKELSRIEKWYQIQESLTSYYTSIYSKNIERQHIFDALFLLLSEKHRLEWPGDLWDVDIDYNEALNLLNGFDFDIIFNEIETDKEIFPDWLLVQYKVKIKSKGLIWVINKYDPDSFPSNPHAHQLDNNIKLDLSNGKCYKKREYIYTIKKKALLSIRDKAAIVYKGELPSLTI